MTKEDVVRQWIEKAERDLKVAQYDFSAKNEDFYDAACFHSQQAAEKYIKALLSHRSIYFSKTHVLSDLVELFPEEIQQKFSAHDLDTLSDYAVTPRYPEAEKGPGLSEAAEALKMAERVKDAVLSLLKDAQS